MRDRNLLGVKSRQFLEAGSACFWICACIYNGVGIRQLYPFLGPAHRILEKQGPFDHRCTKRKNLTHLESILLFKDSSGPVRLVYGLPTTAKSIPAAVAASKPALLSSTTRQSDGATRI